MANKVIYEWCYETVEDGDIIDSDHRDRLCEFLDVNKTDTLCLIRNEGNDDDGLINRLWAYVEGGKLPEYFTDSYNMPTGYKVPQRFHKELSAI